MSSFVQKATPFFEHIVIGFAFAAMGYLFFWTFNTSFLGIFGMAAVCFGGLKILIGMIIYGLWVFALIFRPDYLKKKEEEEKEANLNSGKSPADGGKQEGWITRNAPFVAKHWGTMLELGILITGFLIIVITRNGL